MRGSHESAEAAAKAFDTEAEFYEDEHQQHRVKITKPFYLGMHEVTQEQYEKMTGNKPLSGSSWVKEGAEYPVTCVSWEGAQEFCR